MKNNFIEISNQPLGILNPLFRITPHFCYCNGILSPLQRAMQLFHQKFKSNPKGIRIHGGQSEEDVAFYKSYLQHYYNIDAEISVAHSSPECFTPEDLLQEWQENIVKDIQILLLRPVPAPSGSYQKQFSIVGSAKICT